MKKFENADAAILEIVNAITNFVGNRTWTNATCTVSLGENSSKSECLLVYEDKIDRTGSWSDVTIAEGDAARYIQKKLLDETGTRLWGISVTIFPDSRHVVKYDYDPPSNHMEDSLDLALRISQGELVPSKAFDSIWALDITPGKPINSLETTASILDGAMRSLIIKTKRLIDDWDFGREDNWNAELEEGRLSFTFYDRHVDTKVQVVGTYNTKDGTFLTGWDHPSVPLPLRLAANRVRSYGQEQEIPILMQRKLACSEYAAWQLTALAAQLIDAQGAYRGKANGTWVYMVFSDVVVAPVLAKN